MRWKLYVWSDLVPALSSVHAVGIDKELQGAGLADWWGVHVGADGKLSKLYTALQEVLTQHCV